MKIHLRNWLVLPIVVIAACGCGNTATVTGKVTYKGRPVTYGSVIFLSADRTARSGVIEPDGSYAVEGVSPGGVKIAVISHDPSRGRSVKSEHSPRPGKKRASAPKTTFNGWFPLPPRFEDPESSGLVCTVGSGQVSYDIDLK